MQSHPNILYLNSKADAAVYLQESRNNTTLYNIVDARAERILRPSSYNPLDDISLSQSDISSIVMAIVNAMIHIHSNNAVHGNLKLSKIIIDRSNVTGNVKVVMYPLSKVSSGKLYGIKSGYIAPEVLYKGGQVTTASDVYNFGVLLVLLLNIGRPVYRNEDGSHCFFLGELIKYYHSLKYNNDIIKKKKKSNSIVTSLFNKKGKQELEKEIDTYMKSIKSSGYYRLLSKCLSSNPNYRPTFQQIQDYLVNGNTECIAKSHLTPRRFQNINQLYTSVKFSLPYDIRLNLSPSKVLGQIHKYLPSLSKENIGELYSLYHHTDLQGFDIQNMTLESLPADTDSDIHLKLKYVLALIDKDIFLRNLQYGKKDKVLNALEPGDRILINQELLVLFINNIHNNSNDSHQ